MSGVAEGKPNAIDVLRDYIRLDGSSIFAGQREADAALDTLVAQVDTLTRDARTAMDAAERFREQGMKDAERAEAAEAALADTRRALEEIEELCTHWKRHDATGPDEPERWRKAAIARAKLVGEHARRALAGDTEGAA